MIKLIDIDKDRRWDSYVMSHQHSNLYHHSSWKNLIERTYGYQPYYFVYEDEVNAIKGLFPLFLIKTKITGNRFVSLPLSDYSDILSNNKKINQDLLTTVLEKIQEKNMTDLIIKAKKVTDCFDSNRFDVDNQNRNHVLELSQPPEKLFTKFHKNNVQRNIKKAQQSGMLIQSGNSERDMRIFYDLYVSTRKKHGLLPQPFKFFKNIWEIFEPKNMLEVLIAFENNRAIAGILSISFKDTKYYLYGGSNYNFLQKKPNHLLLWTAIKNAYLQNLRYFDFGRTSVTNTGLLEFKRRWATIEQDTPYFFLKNNSFTPRIDNKKLIKSEIISNLISKMPTSVLKIIGSIVYKHFG